MRGVWERMDTEARALWACLVGAAVAAACLSVGARLHSAVSGQRGPVHPIDVAVGLARGSVPGAVLWWAVGTALAAAALIAAAAVVARRAWRSRHPGASPRRRRGDEAARSGASRRDLEALGEEAAREKAERLRVDAGGAVGLPIGRLLRAGRPLLFSSWEDVSVMVAGPRTGKTTGWVVPRILAAPGAVVATSNKRDIVDLTGRARAAHGPVHVFDPQGILGDPPACWWNILAGVTTATRAIALAEVFIDTTRAPGARVDAFFDGKAKELVAALLLAAASGGRAITAVHTWLATPSDDEPVRLLRAAGHQLMAQSLHGVQALPAQTRGGVYGGASQIMSFLLNDEAIRWVTPVKDLPQFEPERFAAGEGTLYCLSQEGRGSASPIVTALTAAVIEAALDHAKTQEGGRLARPMLVALDEAANVCRWRELPDLYSHFGSRGIVVDTVLQSWSQGAAVWGEAGMNKLWSAANVRAYAGGVSEDRFLQMLSHLIGTRWIDQTTSSTGRSGPSTSVALRSQQRPIATVADLQSMPAGRAWVLSSGAPAAYVATVPYWEAEEDRTHDRRRA